MKSFLIASLDTHSRQLMEKICLPCLLGIQDECRVLQHRQQQINNQVLYRINFNSTLVLVC